MSKFIRVSIVMGVTLFHSACDQSTKNTNIDKCLAVETLGSFIIIPQGDFTQAMNAIYPEEGYPREVRVNSFSIQTHEVTNSQFQQFVLETGYKTEAEINIGSKDPSFGSALFSIDDNGEGAWGLVNGATWRHPDGANSSITNKLNFPVVHVSKNDAQAYAKWANGRLPTEEEWEYAAQLGIADKTKRYSGAFDNNGKPIANTWQGLFPIANSNKDGFKGIAPVGCFNQSSIGLYDMIGNVWEWTDTTYNETNNVIKGGSFLCAPNYCKRFRPAARQPHEINFSTNHIGFRIVKDI